ncbi:curli-like amyloid fiber formation chaperone CsgH [Aurantimonas sp. A2-1-M11]|uniref:curli-like amyloid fiber formation chaperone CsgH n=1 Tax=Aurantimonas sp. A2-1-M11 TaxID=3113712 RepID=UPI002F931DE7
MLKLMTLLALPFIPFVYLHGAAAIAHTATETEDGVGCELRSTQVSRGVQLQAVATADRMVAGDYQFEVDKRGSAGSSQIAQSGDFDLKSGEEIVLGNVALGMDDRASYAAKLTLQWNGGEVSCSARYPSEV